MKDAATVYTRNTGFWRLNRSMFLFPNVLFWGAIIGAKKAKLL
jgi:hypothetical protein